MPKFKLVGFDPSAPAVTPVPDRAIFKFGFDAVDVMATFPLAAPAAVGANDTLKVALCPAVSVTGAEIPLRVNFAPLIVT